MSPAGAYMNIYALFHDAISHALEGLQAEGFFIRGAVLDQHTTEMPRDTRIGDIVNDAPSRFADLIADENQRNGQVLAAEIIKRLDTSDPKVVSSVGATLDHRIAIKLAPELLAKIVQAAAFKDPAFFERPRRGRHACVILGSFPLRGPILAEQTRTIIVGDVLANLLEYTGEECNRIYYFRDAASRLQSILASITIRYQQVCGKAVDIPDDFIDEEWIVMCAKAVAEHCGSTGRDFTRPFIGKAFDAIIRTMKKMIGDDLKALGTEARLIRDSDLFHERFSRKTGMQELAADLRKCDDSLVEADGVDNVLSLDCAGRTIIIEQNGVFSEAASEMANYRDEVDRGGFGRLIDVYSSNVSSGKEVTRAALARIRPNAAIEYLECADLMLAEKGDIQYAQELVDKIGLDGLRMTVLLQHHGSTIAYAISDYSATLVVVKTALKECNLFLQHSTRLPPRVDNPYPLIDDEEISLSRGCALFPQVIEQAARHRQPHRVAMYLYALSYSMLGYCANVRDRPIKISDGDYMDSRDRLFVALKHIIRQCSGILGLTKLED